MTTEPRTVSLAVKAPAEAVWNALTDGSISPAYYYGFSIETTLEPGSDYRYVAGGAAMITGVITDVDPGRSLAMTFNGVWMPEVAELPETGVRFDLSDPAMPMPGVTILTLTHTGMPDTPVADHVEHGWVTILSGLKTLLETGEPLVAAPAA